MAKARIIEQAATLYGGPGVTDPVAELPVGSEIELGAVTKSGGLAWVATSVSDGRHGYLQGNAKVFTIRTATVVQDEVALQASPSAGSGVVMRHQKNTRLELIDQVKGEGGIWVRVRDSTGNEGFIDGKTRIQSDEAGAGAQKDVALANKAAARRAMGWGALWCVGGTIVTAVTYSSASESGGTYFVMWGPMLFGGYRFLRGLFLYLKSD
jgi:hypothetical protein